MNKPGPKDLKPPDLWMDHDQMELKNLDSSMGMTTTLPAGGKDDAAGMMDARRNSFISKCALALCLLLSCGRT